MSENKNVFDRLDEIEQRVGKPNQTISEMIGEPFDPYFERSTVYYYEPDIRMFNREKKKLIAKHSIFVAFCLLLLIAEIAISVWVSNISVWGIVCDVALLLSAIFPLIRTLTLKNKCLAKSKWNIKNHEFYKMEDKLAQEDSHGLLWTLLLIYNILVAVGIFVVMIVDCILFDVSFYFSLVRSILVSLVIIFGLSSSSYDFNSYMFETEDSYVIYQYFSWEKHNK